MKCPKCGLINPDNAMWCDCGYDFQADVIRAKCPQCGEINPGSAICPYCGYYFQTPILKTLAPNGQASDSSGDIAPRGSLIVRNHAILFQISFLVGLVGMLAFFFGVLSPAFFHASDAASSASEMVKMVILGVLVSVTWGLVMKIPVRCNDPHCNGRVDLEERPASPFTVRFKYTCRRCGAIYETEILFFMSSAEAS